MTNYVQMMLDDNGLKINEKFMVGDSVCFITEGYRLVYESNGMSDPFILDELMKGYQQIEKLPFKPKIDGIYWRIAADGGAERSFFCSLSLDFNYYEIGNCYETRAEASKPENVKKWKDYYDEIFRELEG